MRTAGLIQLRRHHPHIIGQRTRDLLDDLETGGVDASVIGAENSHPKFASFDCAVHSRSASVSYPSRVLEANFRQSSERVAKRERGLFDFGRLISQEQRRA